MKIIQLYVRDVLQNFLQLKNYFLRSSLCPFHCPSGSFPAAPWLTPCYSATSVAGAAADWYRRLFFSALVCRIARPQPGLTYTDLLLWDSVKMLRIYTAEAKSKI